jgi:hypothetical protein
MTFSLYIKELHSISKMQKTDNVERKEKNNSKIAQLWQAGPPRGKWPPPLLLLSTRSLRLPPRLLAAQPRPPLPPRPSRPPRQPRPPMVTLPSLPPLTVASAPALVSIAPHFLAAVSRPLLAALLRSGLAKSTRLRC